jgi:hypothetical protein
MEEKSALSVDALDTFLNCKLRYLRQSAVCWGERHPKREGRALPAMAFDFDSTTVRAENRFGYREAHSRAMQEPLAAPAIELVEDVRLLSVINSLPLVGDTYQQAVGSEHSANMHWRTRWGIAGSILQQMTKYAADQLPIKQDGGHIGGNVHCDRAAAQQGMTIFKREINHLVQALRL